MFWTVQAHEHSMHTSCISDSSQKNTNYPTSIKPVDIAIVDWNALDSQCIASLAGKHNVNNSTISRRWKGITAIRGQAAED